MMSPTTKEGYEFRKTLLVKALKRYSEMISCDIPTDEEIAKLNIEQLGTKINEVCAKVAKINKNKKEKEVLEKKKNPLKSNFDNKKKPFDGFLYSSHSNDKVIPQIPSKGSSPYDRHPVVYNRQGEAASQNEWYDEAAYSSEYFRNEIEKILDEKYLDVAESMIEVNAKIMEIKSGDNIGEKLGRNTAKYCDRMMEYFQDEGFSREESIQLLCSMIRNNAVNNM